MALLHIELARQAAEIDKELRDKAKGIFNDANMDKDEDENFNGYTSNGCESANKSITADYEKT